jgi:hypothetical protein
MNQLFNGTMGLWLLAALVFGVFTACEHRGWRLAANVAGVVYLVLLVLFAYKVW